MNLNLFQQANLEPSTSAYFYFHGPLNYDATPLGTLGCNIITHKKTGARNLWEFRGTAGWNVGVALHHYQCHNILAKSTKESQVSDKVEFRHYHLTLQDITPSDFIIHGVTTLTCT